MEIVVIFVFCLVITLTYSNLVTVETSLGTVQGNINAVDIYTDNDTLTEYTYRQYLGIPYAEPPIGTRRFTKPVRKEAWSGAHNGTYHRAICHQGVDTASISIIDSVESEDCLTLDIYTPDSSNGTQYAVMIFLYGPYGGSRGYIGDALSVFGEIVVVVINYRTTFLGFYSSGDDSAPGNYGLWDQQLALHWVRDNIAVFQGDPARITVAGYSAGAQYALLQAMFPGNSGLIQNVIAHSGMLVPTYRNSPYNNTGAPAAVTALGCERETSDGTIECLRSKSLQDLDAVLRSLPLTFTPVIDGDFIRDDPESVLMSRESATQDIREAFSRVGLLTGINNQEGAMHVVRMWAALLDQEADTFSINSSSFRDVVVKTALDLVFVSNLSKAIIDTVTFQYSDLKDPNNGTKIRESTVRLSTDIDATIPAVKTANLHTNLSDSSRTYFFQFSVRLGMGTDLTPSWLDGANHGEEIYYLFGFSDRNLAAWTHSQGFEPATSQRQVSRNMMRMWSNFVKYGNPTNMTDGESVPGLSEWPLYTDMTSAYVDITSDGILSQQYFREPFVTFWTKIIPQLIDLDLKEDVTVSSPVKRYSDRFHIDSVTSDNVIIALVTMSGSLLIAMFLICSLAVIRGTYEKYTVKNV